MWIHVYADTCVSGYMCKWIHGYVDTCASGCMCMWIYVYSRASLLRGFGYNAVGRGPRFSAARGEMVELPAIVYRRRWLRPGDLLIAMVIHTNALHVNKTFTHSVVI